MPVEHIHSDLGHMVPLGSMNGNIGHVVPQTVITQAAVHGYEGIG